MCQSRVLVPIPEFIKADPLCSSASDSSVFDGGEYAIDEQGRQCFVLDECLVPAILALWGKGIKTSGCCCGHGTGSGVIGLVTEYDSGGIHLMEAPPYILVEVVERRRHENIAYQRGYDAALVTVREKP